MSKVYLVDGKRTPQVKSGAEIKDIAAPFLGHYLVRNLMAKYDLPKDAIDEVIFGNTGTPAKYPNVGRVIALEAGLDKKTSGYSVHRNCASGMEALSQAYIKIASGRDDLIFAGGVESMSQMPLMYGKKMTEFFMNMMKARTVAEKLKILSSFRLTHLKPIIAIEQGLTDPFCGLNMGATAEKLARELKISREEQDQFALFSHQKAVAAQKAGKFTEEILPIVYGSKLDKILTQDVGPRDTSSMDKLAKFAPYFEKRTGTVTVANSCPITDGGSACLLASEEAVKKYKLEPMARIVDFHFHGLEPERMGMGPLLASHYLLQKTKLKMDQMDLLELNEAFAAQAIAVLRGFKDKAVSSRWGIEKPPGEVEMSKVNVNGGAIALGHPVGSTGSRLIVSLAHELIKRNGRYGLATLCIGGGQGGAMIIENLK
ncbi:MAG: thiolase family protein [Bacteriovoracaceae bacterium]|nr:thiolase family protein [Bacteriovoracaceae bacterium]